MLQVTPKQRLNSTSLTLIILAKTANQLKSKELICKNFILLSSFCLKERRQQDKYRYTIAQILQLK